MMRAHNAAVDLVVARPLRVMCFAAPADAAPMDEAAAALCAVECRCAEADSPLAEQGNALAQFNLGVSYDQGWGVQPDAGEALKWYRLAAEQGYSLAPAKCLATYLQQRPRRAAGFTEALKWYGLAADQGNAFAQNGLGLMYESAGRAAGHCPRPHVVQPVGLTGPRAGAENRERVRASITNVQLAEAQKLARGWKPAGK